MADRCSRVAERHFRVADRLVQRRCHMDRPPREVTQDSTGNKPVDVDPSPRTNASPSTLSPAVASTMGPPPIVRPLVSPSRPVGLPLVASTPPTLDVLKEAQFLTRLSAPVVTNLRGIRQNSIVLEDWETLLATLKDDATAEGWTLASKVQRDRTGGWRGKIYCNHRGSLSGKRQLVQQDVGPCTWSATISKQRGQAINKMVFSNFCGHHNHNMQVPDSLPERYTSHRKGSKIRRTLQEQMTTAEITWAKNMARFTCKAHALAGIMSTWALDNGMGQVDYDRKLMWNIITMVGGALGTKGDQMKDFIELGHRIEQKGGTFYYNLSRQ